ncbi:hypothetical protein D3C86_1975600 [compost metagenome]
MDAPSARAKAENTIGLMGVLCVSVASDLLPVADLRLFHDQNNQLLLEKWTDPDDPTQFAVELYKSAISRIRV